MTAILLQHLDYLHDAEVHLIELSISESGSRLLRINLRGDPECGFEAWNNKNLWIDFVDPLIVHCDLFGHMSNPETLGSWDFKGTARLSASIAMMTESGLPAPKCIASLSLNSGSQIEVACQEILIREEQVKG